jgi:hypothetical protein
MCLIIDTNIAHKFEEPHQDVQPIVRWLLGKHKKKPPRAVIGRQLREELNNAGEGIRRFLQTLGRAGRLLDIDNDVVTAEQTEVEALLERNNIRGADDPHVLALARVSGSRLLASQDSRSGLHALFKDRRFLQPPGKVYQNASHERLLHAAPACKG